MKGWAVILAVIAAGPLCAQDIPLNQAAPEVSELPEPRPDTVAPATADPEDRSEEVAPDAPPEVDPTPDTPPRWQTLAETPEDYAACVSDLDALGTVYAERAPLTGDLRDCGIANPVAVSQILPGVALRPDAVMRCETARALGTWVQGTVIPAARRTGTLAALTAIDHGSTFVCRRRGGVSSGKVSEHGFGNAVDVMGFRFADDTALAVEPRADSGTMAEAFQRAVRGGACLDFTTVLGPGTDAAHADHLHLDVKSRNGGYRICQ